MPNFIIGVPVETGENEKTVEVTVDISNPLSVGRHTFQLVVQDQDGNKSLADKVDVIIKDTQNPTAVMEAPSQVEYGQSFTLDGSKSSDVQPGRIVRYIWTMIE